MKHFSLQLVLTWIVIVSTFSTTPLPAAVTTVNSTFGAWSSNPITVGNMTFSLLGYSGFSPTQSVRAIWSDIDSNPLTVNDSVQSLILTDLGNLAPSSTYTLNYQAKINVSHLAFQTVSLDTNYLRGTTKATKDLYSDYPGGNSVLPQLVAINGIPDGPIPFSSEYGLLYVRDVLTLGRNSYVASMANTFTQVEAPEPGTFLVWGALGGLATLVRSRLNNRRRRKEGGAA